VVRIYGVRLVDEMKIISHKVVEKGRTAFLCPRKIPLDYYYYYYYYYY